MLWVTDMGWMMGPWLIFGTLRSARRMVLYDGAPDYPDPDRLWALVERHRVTHLGISPTLIRALMSHGDERVAQHDLSSLRVFGSTGEPWNPDPWLWFCSQRRRRPLPDHQLLRRHRDLRRHRSAAPCCPLKPCALLGPIPGMAADVVDEHGQPVRGAVGELVIRQAVDRHDARLLARPERYLDTYWSRFPGVWVHGDWAAIDDDGLWYILGRSDDTIKVAGKRLGPAEVESLLVAHPAVVEAAAIGVPDELKGERAGVLLRAAAGRATRTRPARATARRCRRRGWARR